MKQNAKKTFWYNVCLNFHQIIILASIVEKETSKREERPIIAGVYINRLSGKLIKSRLLAADPTVSYGCILYPNLAPSCKYFKGVLQRIHTNDPKNPYNTYQHPGLPPGPICNPGLESIKSVLNAQKNDYLYFVAKNNGYHYFSRTFTEHQRAIKKYRN
jgi:UPF0755 protein